MELTIGNFEHRLKPTESGDVTTTYILPPRVMLRKLTLADLDDLSRQITQLKKEGNKCSRNRHKPSLELFIRGVTAIREVQKITTVQEDSKDE